MSRLHLAALSTLLVAFACTKERSGLENDGADDMPTSSGDGDGDGDGSTTVPGNTDETEESTTEDPSTDTDDPSTDTEDPDSDTDDPSTDTDDPTDGCSEGDSGNAPFDQHLYDDIDEENEPHGGMAFVPDEDFGGVDACDIFLQDCPEGEKCVPYASSGGSWDANKCVPVMGTGMVGDSCLWGGIIEATDNCDESTACWGVNAQGEGVCTLFCGGTPQAPICPEGTACIQGNNGSIAFCEASCNPLTQNCPDGSACYWGGDSFTCTHTSTDLPLGEPCGFINDCAEGLTCTPAASVPNCQGPYCCAQWCDLDCGQGTCDQPGTSCVSFFAGNAPEGHADVGVCLSN